MKLCVWSRVIQLLHVKVMLIIKIYNSKIKLFSLCILPVYLKGSGLIYYWMFSCTKIFHLILLYILNDSSNVWYICFFVVAAGICFWKATDHGEQAKFLIISDYTYKSFDQDPGLIFIQANGLLLRVMRIQTSPVGCNKD